MGPRSADRGNSNHVVAQFHSVAASMGPRSADRGNREISGCPADKETLQWGRDQLIAETYVDRYGGLENLKLQWGRDQLIAETAASSGSESRKGPLQWGRDQLIAETP